MSARNAHRIAELDRSLDVPAWLEPWLADECDGASAHERLALLLEVARDRSLYRSGWPVDQGFVHPGELEQFNGARLHAREDGNHWVLSHDDGRLPIRIRDRRLVGVVTDHAALRAAAAHAPSPRELAPELGEHAAGIGFGRSRKAVLYGAAIDQLAERATDARCERIDDDDEEKLAVAIALLGGLAMDEHADRETWSIWLARHRRDAIATVAFGEQRGHCNLAWVAGPREVALALLWYALDEVAALDGALTVTAAVNQAALGAALETLGFARLQVPSAP